MNGLETNDFDGKNVNKYKRKLSISKLTSLKFETLCRKIICANWSRLTVLI